MPQQPARPRLRAAQAAGLTVFLATAAILSGFLFTRLVAGLGDLEAAAAAFSTACATVAAFAMLIDAVDLWVRGRRMTVHSVKLVRSLVFVAVLAALAASIFGGNALVGLALSPALFVYLFIARRSPAPLAPLASRFRRRRRAQPSRGGLRLRSASRQGAPAAGRQEATVSQREVGLTAMKKLGLIVNPVAGVGGRVGLKGSDGADVLRAALERGAQRDAPRRARQALERLARVRDHVEVLTWPGEMGEDEARAAGYEPRVLGSLDDRRSYVLCELERVGGEPAAIACDDFVLTTAADTEQAARDLLAAGVDLILFAGGDGTARNICNAVGDRVPVIGVPAGVKIHSAVYATTPAAAGDVAALYLHERPAGVQLREGEVMDIDEEAFRQNRVSAHLYGFMTVPYARGLTQSAKAGGVAGEQRALNDIATEVIAGMVPGALYVLGPGTTTRTVMERLGLPKTLLGVDAVRDRGLAGSDLTGDALAALVDAAPEAFIVVTVIGGQGHVFGRGNQQISPAVIRRVGADRIIIIATQTKLLSLEGRPLLVDTGDPALDEQLGGYAKVITALGERTMYKVGA